MSKGKTTSHRCGHVAIIGRPNVGKSTLVNRLVGQKFSITSRKAQTTRHRLLGIKTTANAQVIYVDTPGLHAGSGRALNRYMNRAASTALVGVDLILFLVEAGRWTDGDSHVLERLAETQASSRRKLAAAKRARQHNEAMLVALDKEGVAAPEEAKAGADM